MNLHLFGEVLRCRATGGEMHQSNKFDLHDDAPKHYERPMNVFCVINATNVENK